MNKHKLAELDRSFGGTALASATISIYTTLSEAEPVWRRAVEHCACFVFQTYEWNFTWRDTVGRTETTAEQVVHVAAADGRTLMILPLAVSTRRSLRVLQFLGGTLTDYNAPLIDRAFAESVDTGAFVRLWHAVLRVLPKVDAVWLQRMPKIIDGVRNPMIELSRVRHTDDAFAAMLPRSFEEFRSSRSTQFFAQIRRHRRRLAKLDNVEVCFPTDDRARLEVLQTLAAQKSQWLRERGMANMFDRPENRQFYERLSTMPMQAGNITVACLRVGDQIAATAWGAIFGDRYYFLMPSYGVQWTSYSAGRILLESVLQRCISQGDVRTFDLTLGDENYKQSWSDHCLPLHEHLVARSFRGAAFVAYRRAHGALRRNRRLRDFVRSLFARMRARGGTVRSQAGAT